jgi:hypothetical protein
MEVFVPERVARNRALDGDPRPVMSKEARREDGWLHVELFIVDDRG